jgi:hypothetical protein
VAAKRIGSSFALPPDCSGRIDFRMIKDRVVVEHTVGILAIHDADAAEKIGRVYLAMAEALRKAATARKPRSREKGGA